MPVAATRWSLPQIDRKAYLVCAGLLILISALLPTSFLFVGGPAGWLLLFTARVRDIGTRVWIWPTLLLVGTEMFGREIVSYLGHHLSTSIVGLFVIAVIIAHLSLMIILAFPRTGAKRALV